MHEKKEEEEKSKKVFSETGKLPRGKRSKLKKLKKKLWNQTEEEKTEALERLGFTSKPDSGEEGKNNSSVEEKEENVAENEDVADDKLNGVKGKQQKIFKKDKKIAHEVAAEDETNSEELNLAGFRCRSLCNSFLWPHV